MQSTDEQLLAAVRKGGTAKQIAETVHRPLRDVLDDLNRHRAAGVVARRVHRQTSVARWQLA